MTFRQHLLLDSIGQALLILLFAFLIVRSSTELNILQLTPIVIFGWQFINAVLSYKFFERTSKRLFVRLSGFSFIIIFGLRGAMWFISLIPTLTKQIDSLSGQFEFLIFIILPFLCAIMAIWYLYLTFRDLYNMIYNTI